MLSAVQDVRGTLGMYLFIIEEAIQTVGMACWTLYKDNRFAEVQELAQWIIDDIIDPAIEFNNTYGMATYPLNQAYAVFYTSARKNMETYLAMTKGLRVAVVSQPELNIRCVINGSLHETPFEMRYAEGSDVSLQVIEVDKGLYAFHHMTVDGFSTELSEHTFKISEDTIITLFYETK